MKRKLIQAFAVILILSGTVHSQTLPGDSITIAANADLTHGFVHMIFFGRHYRPLWATPVRIPVIDLERSGFKIIKEGGSNETFNLRLTDSLKREFVARSVKKDLTKALPDNMQKSMVARVFSDLMSANHPYGPLMVAPMAKAAGVFHSNPKLYVVHIDTNVSRDFRSGTTAMLVMIEERADESWSQFPKFNYAKSVVGTEKFMTDRLNDNDILTDGELFLRTRLLDLLIGDWSRHEDQYRWAVRDSGDIKFYQPIPRDRDHAFYRYNDGLLNRISLLFVPKTVTFGKKIKNVEHLHIVGAMLSKLILTSVTREKWYEIVASVKDGITDSVIENAVNQLPPEIYAKASVKLIKHLKARRNQLPRVADDLYDLIFTSPNIVGSNKDELFKVTRLNRTETLVEVYKISKKGNTDVLMFSRKFNTAETKEINLFGLEGSDRFEISGEADRGIKILVIPGPGEDEVKIAKGLSRGITVDDSEDFNYTQTILKEQLK
jgi:hypothetical protein